MEKRDLVLKFRGIDTFNQPIFKGENKSYYGTNDVLFSHHATAEEVIKKIESENIKLLYFGSYFDCEPEGLRLKEEINVILIK